MKALRLVISVILVYFAGSLSAQTHSADTPETIAMAIISKLDSDLQLSEQQKDSILVKARVFVSKIKVAHKIPDINERILTKAEIYNEYELELFKILSPEQMEIFFSRKGEKSERFK